jgi:hypothetical protein
MLRDSRGFGIHEGDEDVPQSPWMTPSAITRIRFVAPVGLALDGSSGDERSGQRWRVKVRSSRS